MSKSGAKSGEEKSRDVEVNGEKRASRLLPMHLAFNDAEAIAWKTGLPARRAVLISFFRVSSRLDLAADRKQAGRCDRDAFAVVSRGIRLFGIVKSAREDETWMISMIQ